MLVLGETKESFEEIEDWVFILYWEEGFEGMLAGGGFLRLYFSSKFLTHGWSNTFINGIL